MHAFEIGNSAAKLELTRSRDMWGKKSGKCKTQCLYRLISVCPRFAALLLTSKTCVHIHHYLCHFRIIGCNICACLPCVLSIYGRYSPSLSRKILREGFVSSEVKWSPFLRPHCAASAASFIKLIHDHSLARLETSDSPKQTKAAAAETTQIVINI